MARLNDFDIDTFLREYWQKKPLLIRGALDAGLFTLSPAEFAGLACEPDAESRLIIGAERRGYQLRHGPFSENTFTELPDRDWTVLVQAVDHLVPEVADLLDYFRFIPNWRVDDIMVSYAAPGGSAGPHYDNYDVFLIQGRGSRRWRIGEPVQSPPPLSPHPDLRLLSRFEADCEWELGVGDMLYLPPRFTHWGVSTSADCMTYSVGFRSPGTGELLSEFCDHALATLSDERHYRDPGMQRPANPGEISPAAIDAIQQMLLEPFADKARIALWFGRYITLPKYERETEDTASPGDREVLLAKLRRYDQVYRDSASRFAYIDTADGTHLFVNGEDYRMTPDQGAFAKHLCSTASISSRQLIHWLQDPALAEIAVALYRHGSLYFADELYD